jgi:phosphatidylserine decarboxylase
LEIKYYNRITNKIEQEIVYGDKFIEWLYKTPSGKNFSHLICKAPISKIYGAIQDLAFSQKKINPFIKNFNINMNDYLPEEGRNIESPYSTFNQFFIRRFKNGKRPIVANVNEMAAFAEARYYGYENLLSNETIPVKGVNLSSSNLLNHSKWSDLFFEGPLCLARLCPVDYHRFHYPDDGIVLDNYRIHGDFHSVNPLALKAKEDIFITNERHVTILETKNFGKLAYIEVGATCVGKIIQSKPLFHNQSFKKGEEKGYFLFGGSTVIVLGEKGKWKPADDIIKNTKNGIETYLHLGTTVATRG